MPFDPDILLLRVYPKEFIRDVYNVFYVRMFVIG